MSQLNNQLRFNDDGTPRRRYELDNSSDGKAALSVTIGLVLASAVALIKNVLYPARAPDLPPLPTEASADVRSAPVETGISLFDGESDPLRIDTLEDGAGAGAVPAAVLRASLGASRSSPAIDTAVSAGVHIGMGSHAAGNDNKALYGAAPGHAVQLAASDTVHLSAINFEGRGFSASGARSAGGGGHVGDDDSDALLPGQKVPDRASDHEGADAGDKATAGDDSGDFSPSARCSNRAPVVSGNTSLGNRFINQVIVIGLADLLVHATDADGDTLSVCEITPSSGTLVANREGGWNYVPDPDATGEVTFSYSVSDGHAVAPATATLMLAATPVEHGTAAHGGAEPGTAVRTGSDCPVTALRDDFGVPLAEKITLGATPITGTSAADVIHGTQGNDVILAGAGDDIVDGGDGNDVILGEDGNDTLTGGKGNDFVSGGDGDDTIVATIDDGNDVYDGGEGEDTLDLTALSGAEPVMPQAASAGAAVEAVVAAAASGVPASGAAMTMATSDGPAALVVEVVVDACVPDAEVAHLGDGGLGDGGLVAVSDAPDAGGCGLDDGVMTGAEQSPVGTAVVVEAVVPVADAAASVVVPVVVGAAVPAGEATPVVEAVIVETTVPVDQPGAASEVVPGDAVGVYADDVLPVELEPAFVKLFDVVVDLEAGTVDSAATGHDHIVNIENVKTGASDDAIIGNGQDNKLSAGAGHDYIDGNGGNDTLDGGADSDIVLGGTGDDVIVATADGVSDFYSGGEGSDTYDASLIHTDVFIDLSEGTVSSATLGNDTISGIEDVKCGSGNDTIVANDDSNVLFGGLGDDLFVFHSTASIGNGNGGPGGGHDKIMDFAVGDKIDISGISKEFAVKLDDLYQDQDIKDFFIISNLESFSKPGELQVSYDMDKDATFIRGNIDFDADAEFLLELQGQHSITTSDFHHH